MLVDASLQRVSVCVNNDSSEWRARSDRESRHVLLLLFANMQTSVQSARNGTMTTRGELKSLTLRDCLSADRPALLTVAGDTVVDFEYIMRGTEASSAGEADFLRLHIRSLRFVYWRARTETHVALFWYVMANLGSVAAPAGAAATVSQEQSALAQPRRVQYVMDFDQPLIVIPPVGSARSVAHSADAGDALVLDLGYIRLTNAPQSVVTRTSVVEFDNEPPPYDGPEQPPPPHTQRKAAQFLIHHTAECDEFTLPFVRTRERQSSDDADHDGGSDSHAAIGNDNSLKNDTTTRERSDSEGDRQSGNLADVVECERATLTCKSMRVLCTIGGESHVLVPGVDVELLWDMRTPAPLPEQPMRIDVSDIVINLDNARVKVSFFFVFCFFFFFRIIRRFRLPYPLPRLMTNSKTLSWLDFLCFFLFN